MNRGIVGLLALVLTLSGGAVRADHTSPHGSIDRLTYEAQELYREVRPSGLAPNVVQAVYNFTSDAFRLEQCADSLRFHRDHMGVPAHCQNQFLQTKSSFSLVSRYLRDTQYDFPYVYRQWNETRVALQALSTNPGPGPGPGTYRCVAVDAGWEEHAGGHMGYGRTLAQAQQQALYECRRFHGQCRIRSCQ